MQELDIFYKTLYSPGTTYTPKGLDQYLRQIDFPELTESQRAKLEVPLTVEELQVAVRTFPNCKAPGEDGIPMEVYKHYSEELLPHLLKVFNESWREGLFHLHCPKQTSFYCSSLVKTQQIQGHIARSRYYRATSRYVITSTVHDDQAGFMPNKSTAINLRRPFLKI